MLNSYLKLDARECVIVLFGQAPVPDSSILIYSAWGHGLGDHTAAVLQIPSQQNLQQMRILQDGNSLCIALGYRPEVRLSDCVRPPTIEGTEDCLQVWCPARHIVYALQCTFRL